MDVWFLGDDAHVVSLDLEMAQNRNIIGAIKGILNLSSNGVNVELLLSWVSYASSGLGRLCTMSFSSVL